MKRTKLISEDEGLTKAYQRELELMPVIMDMEMRGVPLDPNILSIQEHWQKEFDKTEEYLKSVVDEKPGTKRMFNALRAKGLINEDLIEYTEKGNAKYGRDQLEKICTDDFLISNLKRRSRLQKQLGTYLNPWSESFKKYGRFYPYYHQVRGEDFGGTRTGRLSSNLQQTPRTYDASENVMNLRALIFPENGDVLLKRDFSGQELRVASHYAEGNILKAYQADPSLDVHSFVCDLIEAQKGYRPPRPIVKGISFLKLYGGGPLKLASQANITEAQARDFFKLYDEALPEFKELMSDVEQLVRSGGLLRTWGGRLYDVEPAQYVNGQKREFYYKLTNYLIQGSSADQTKVAMIRYHYNPRRKGRLLLQVHDELVVSVKEQHHREEMALLKECMDDIEGFDVPFQSDGLVGPSYGELVEFTH